MQELDEDTYQAIHDEVFAEYDTRKNIRTRFYTHAEGDIQASEQAGHPVFRDVPFVMQKGVGNKDFMSRPATDKEIKAFPKEWSEYQARVNAGSQHSLKLLPGFTPATKMAFEKMGVFTVEQLLAYDGEVWPQVAPFLEMSRVLKAAFDYIETGEKPKLRLVNGID